MDWDALGTHLREFLAAPFSPTSAAIEGDRRFPVENIRIEEQGLFSILRHTARTEDGIALSLKQYIPKRGAPPPTTRRRTRELSDRSIPVILCHGLGGNSRAFEVSKERSLAWTLLHQGYTVWLIDLRGSGLSEKPAEGKPWSLDDYIYRDVPAVINYIKEHHQVSHVHWCGHSLGGIVALCALADTPALSDSIKSVITIASALEYEDSAWKYIAALLPFARLVNQDKPFLAESTPVFLSFIQLFPAFISSQKDPKALTSMVGVSVDPVSLPVMTHLGTAVQNGGLVATRGIEVKDPKELSGAPRFIDLMHMVKVPVLAIAGSSDIQCPSEAILRTVEALGSHRKRFVRIGLADGYDQDYGHFDLLLSPKAREDVFVAVLEWLDEADSGLWELVPEEEEEEEDEEDREKMVVCPLDVGEKEEQEREEALSLVVQQIEPAREMIQVEES